MPLLGQELLDREYQFVTNNSFENLIYKEIDKVERFYSKTLDNLVEEFRVILEGNLNQFYTVRKNSLSENSSENNEPFDINFNQFQRNNGLTTIEKNMKRNSFLGEKEMKSLQRAMREIYRDAKLLQNFGIINYTGFVKILKKHDKMLANPSPKNLAKRKVSFEEFQQEDRRSKRRSAINDKILRNAVLPDRKMKKEVLGTVFEKEFYKGKRLDDLIKHCEQKFANIFCGNDISQARVLLLPPKHIEIIEFDAFKIGYHLGIAAILAIWVMWDSGEQIFIHRKDVSIIEQPAFRVYRACAGLLLLHWSWAVSTHVWTLARINFIYLFELDPRHQSPPMKIFNDAAMETIIFLLNLLLYYKTQVGTTFSFFHAGYYPLFLCLYTLKKLFSPWNIKKEVTRV